MSCGRTEIWLMQSESPRADACPDPVVASHLRRCPACQRLAKQLSKLERRWREAPAPTGCDEARLRFLAGLQRPAAMPPPLPAPLPQRGWRIPFPARPRLAVAASLFLALGLGIWMMLMPGRTSAGEEVVERLLEWNLALSRESSPEQRRRLYEEQLPILKHELARARLSPADREFATQLLENGSWLASSGDDPAEEAERFGNLADHLMNRLQKAAADHQPDADRLARHYATLAQQGVGANVEVAVATPVLTPRQKEKLEHTLARNDQHRERLEAMLPHADKRMARDIKKAVEATKHLKRGKDLHDQKQHKEKEREREKGKGKGKGKGAADFRHEK
jgi:hypothetical protein